MTTVVRKEEVFAMKGRSIGLLIGLAVGTAVAQDAQIEAGVRANLDEAEMMAKLMGLMTKREQVLINQRAKDEPLTLPVQFKDKEERRLFAVCHPDCGRIKMQLLNDKGDEVRERTDPNAVNLIAISEPSPGLVLITEGNYQLRVTLLECPRERCAMGVSVWLK